MHTGSTHTTEEIPATIVNKRDSSDNSQLEHATSDRVSSSE